MAIKSNPITINGLRLIDAEYQGSCNSSCFFASVSHNKSFIRSIVVVPKPEGSEDVKSSGKIIDMILDNDTHLSNQFQDMGNDMRTLQELMTLQKRTRLIRTKSI